MVYEKKRSGDPDYDDKVPADQHAAKVVRAGDGREVIMTESNGPVNPDGTHADIRDPQGDAGDNRPAPGDVATEPSTVQTYTPEDGPKPEPVDADDLESDQTAGQSGGEAAQPVDQPAAAPRGRRSTK